MAKKIVFVFILFFISFAKVGFADLLVLDRQTAANEPKHFRSSADWKKLPASINTTGLDTLHEMGSGQFNMPWFMQNATKFPRPLIVVDLRQESHAFIDGQPFTWFKKRDWGNFGLSSEQINCALQNQLNLLQQQATVRLISRYEKNMQGNITPTQYITFTHPTFMSEQALMDKLSITYVHWFVTDHIPPSNEIINQFVALTKALPAQNWIYFHCRAGVGRTTTFMSMLDIMRNSNQVSFKDIIQRQVALGGKDLSRLPANHDSYKYRYAKKRLVFLKCFYQYSQENYTTHFRVNWSAWLAKQKHMSCAELQ